MRVNLFGTALATGEPGLPQPFVFHRCYANGQPEIAFCGMGGAEQKLLVFISGCFPSYRILKHGAIVDYRTTTNEGLCIRLSLVDGKREEGKTSV